MEYAVWTSKNTVKCPVCKTYLGRLIPDRPCSYPCIECQWIFPYDAEGNPKAPQKMNPKKPETCDCEGCKFRDEQEAYRRINKL